MRRRFRRSPGPVVEQGQAFYDDRYTTRSAYHVPYRLSPYYAMWTVIADRLHRQGATSVLEVGCGAGQLAAMLLESGVEFYTGFDLSPVAIELAAGNAPGGHFSVANAFETDLFTTARYDTLVCTEVLEHVTEDRGLIARWPVGATCICSVPDFPAKAHVRFFSDGPEQVRQRYQDLFEGFDVVTIPRPSEKGGRFFLFEGRRV
jgi:SAM-dependent methyltransferase